VSRRTGRVGIVRTDPGAWCEFCEVDDHEDGTPADFWVYFVFPLGTTKDIVLCRRCLDQIGNSIASAIASHDKGRS